MLKTFLDASLDPDSVAWSEGFPKVEMEGVGLDPMRAWWLAVALLLVPMVGCASGSQLNVEVVSTDRSVEQRDPGEMWVAWLHGNETREAVSGEPSHGVCDVAFSHRLDLTNRTLTYDGGRYDSFEPNGTWGVLATDHWDEATFCPIAYGLHPEPDDGVSIDLGPAGNLTVVLLEDGRLTVQGRVVEQGQAARVTYAYTDDSDGVTYRHEGSLTVEMLGAWASEDVGPERR